MADLNLDERIVGKVSVYAGIAKARPEVKKRDTETVDRWLAAAKPVKKAATRKR